MVPQPAVAAPLGAPSWHVGAVAFAARSPGPGHAAAAGPARQTRGGVAGGVAIGVAALGAAAALRQARRGPRSRRSRLALGASARPVDAIYIGVDFGTSGCRAACLDGSGRLVAESSVKYGDDAGAQEWRAALKELLEGLPQRGQAAAICIDGTSSTALLCSVTGDAFTTPLRAPLMYNYACSKAAVERCMAMVPSPTHVAASSTSTVSKAWEFLLGGDMPADAQLVHQADWLAALLHGNPCATDYHNALKLGYDVESLEWPSWLTADSRVASLLPQQVFAPGETVGTVTAEAAAWSGLPEGCRVAAGTTDSIAAFLAARTSKAGEAVTSLGSTLAIKLRSPVRVDDAASGVYSHRLGSSQWLVGGASNTGGAVLRKLFSDEELRQLSAEIDPAKDSGLDYYPLPKAGERFPVCDPKLEPRLEPRPADQARFLHGVLEGISRIEAQGFERLRELGAVPVTRIETAGGGAKNEVWCRMRERLTGVPVSAAEWTEACCGTALLAKDGAELLG